LRVASFTVLSVLTFIVDKFFKMWGSAITQRSLLLLALGISKALASCNHDNCLRAMLGNTALATSFCQTYTTTINTATATTAMPSFVTPCADEPTVNAASRLTSACACAVSPLACTPSAAITENTRNGGFDQPPLPVGSYAASMAPWSYEFVSPQAYPGFMGEAPSPYSSGGAA
jgi:hypothetical protein